MNERQRERESVAADLLGSLDEDLKAEALAAPWMEAINGVKSDYCPTAPTAMRQAVDANRAGFFDILKVVKHDGSWDLTFVDSVCEPPEVFSYGGVIGHVLTYRPIVARRCSRS